MLVWLIKDMDGRAINAHLMIGDGGSVQLPTIAMFQSQCEAEWHLGKYYGSFAHAFSVVCVSLHELEDLPRDPDFDEVLDYSEIGAM